MNKLFIAGVTAALMSTAACNNGSGDNVKLAEKENSRNTDSAAAKQSVTDSTSVTSKQDADFVVKAAAGGMLEIQLGQLAQTNAMSPAVKDFGQMMVTDHGKSGQSLQALAADKHIVLPDSLSNDQKKMRDDLAKKTGKDFDKAYVKMMVDDHKEDISEFQKAVKNGNDPDIKKWADTTLPVLQKHLTAVEKLK